MGLTSEWDETKARQNLRKHGVSFEEATTVFRDSLSLTIEGPLHSDDEDRFVTMGRSARGRLLVIAHTYRMTSIRIISVRGATTRERVFYEESE